MPLILREELVKCVLSFRPPEDQMLASDIAKALWFGGKTGKRLLVARIGEQMDVSL
jgi:hypothetical protein